MAPIPEASVGGAGFVPSYKPFKPEKKLIVEWEDPAGVTQWRDKYPFGYGIGRDAEGNLTGRFKEVFRSSEEVKWAEGFDELGLPWEYEPLRFDMGPQHFYYTPDFRVTGLSIPNSNRPLYIEVKWFGEDVDLTKYVRFTKWYDCDLLVLAHDAGPSKRVRRRNSVLKPQKQRHFLVFRCTHCDTYECFPLAEILLVERRDFIRPEGKTYDCHPCNGMPPDHYLPPSWEYSHAATRPSACQGKPIERMVIPNYFIIQAGTVLTGLVVLPDRGSSELRIAYNDPTPASQVIEEVRGTC